MPDTMEKMKNAGFVTLTSNPEQFADLLKTEIVRWAKIIKEASPISTQYVVINFHSVFKIVRSASFLCIISLDKPKHPPLYFNVSKAITYQKNKQR